ACAMAMARFEATRLLPTPPFPPPIVMKRLAESSFPGVFMFTPPIVIGLTDLEGGCGPTRRGGRVNFRGLAESLGRHGGGRAGGRAGPAHLLVQSGGQRPYVDPAGGREQLP